MHDRTKPDREDAYGRMVELPGDGGGKSPYIAVDDTDAAYARAKAAGATILEEPVRPRLRQL